MASSIEDFVPESPAELARRLGVQFVNPSLLSRALTHRSFLNENNNAMEDNERLEFLGDAVLDFVVGAWVYNRCPEMAEGDLTRLRSALVRNEQLAEFARQFDLGRSPPDGTRRGGYWRPRARWGAGIGIRGCDRCHVPGFGAGPRRTIHGTVARERPGRGC